MSVTDSARTQWAVRLHGARDLRVERIGVPRPRAGEVLIRVSCVGICGSDVHFYEEGRIGPTEIEEPLVLGHEPSGIVVEVGDGVTQDRVGERVSIEPGRPCGGCDECAVGAYNLCQAIEFFAFPPTDGALCEYVAVDSAFAHPVPDDVSDEAAALIEPLAVALHAVHRVAIPLESSVNVIGAGPIGLLVCRLLQLHGARVAVSDPRSAARELAREYGASGTVDPSQGEPLPSADFLFDCSGNPAAIFDGIESLRPRGTAVLVGVGPHAVEVPLTSLRRRELNITSSFRYAGVYPAAIRLVSEGSVDLDRMVTHRYALQASEMAFRDAVSTSPDRVAIKSLVRLELGTHESSVPTRSETGSITDEPIQEPR